MLRKQRLLSVAPRLSSIHMTSPPTGAILSSSAIDLLSKHIYNTKARGSILREMIPMHMPAFVEII